MADHYEKQFQMRVSEEFLQTLDDWRRGQLNIPSRAEAIRQLVGWGIMYERDLEIKENEAKKRELARERRARKSGEG